MKLTYEGFEPAKVYRVEYKSDKQVNDGNLLSNSPKEEPELWTSWFAKYQDAFDDLNNSIEMWNGEFTEISLIESSVPDNLITRDLIDHLLKRLPGQPERVIQKWSLNQEIMRFDRRHTGVEYLIYSENPLIYWWWHSNQWQTFQVEQTLPTQWVLRERWFEDWYIQLIPDTAEDYDLVPMFNLYRSSNVKYGEEVFISADRRQVLRHYVKTREKRRRELVSWRASPTRR